MTTKETPLYCECCGRLKSVILTNLKEQMADKNGIKRWEGHKLYTRFPVDFYDNNNLNYCANCGEKLNEEDIKSTYESRGECHGAPCSEYIILGYTCHECGYEEEF